MYSLQLSGERFGGYAYDFDPEPADRLQCSICCLVLRDPVQTPCGHHFCEVCIKQWLEEENSCPNDRAVLTETSLFPDVALKREILGLKARCPNSRHGCSVVTSLKDIRDHYTHCDVTVERSLQVFLQPEQPDPQSQAEPSASPEQAMQVIHDDENGRTLPSIQVGNNLSCPFCDAVVGRDDLDIHVYVCEVALLPCPNGCETMFRPALMAEHLNRCPRTIRQCVCGLEGSAMDIQNHRNVCPRALAICQRCGDDVQRMDSEEHRRSCGGRITCPFCNETMDQNQIDDHMMFCDAGGSATAILGRRENADTANQIGEGDENDKCCGCAWQKCLVGVVLVVVILALFLAKLAVGTKFYSDCPLERLIPIYLVVSGVFGCLSVVVTVFRLVLSSNNRKVKEFLEIAIYVLYLFMLAWILAGTVWIYRNYPNSHSDNTSANLASTDSTDTDYCDATLFNFAFGTVTAVYVLLAFGILTFVARCVRNRCCR